MKRLKIAMFMDSFYPDINGVILVMENLLRCMSEYADVTLVVPKTGSETTKDNFSLSAPIISSAVAIFLLIAGVSAYITKRIK